MPCIWPASFHCPQNNSNYIMKCPILTISAPGSTSISDCECTSGFFISGDNCIICPAGMFCSSSIAAIPCFQGSYCLQGSTAQQLCPSGSYCVSPSTIVLCKIGSYCPSQSTSEQPCQSGFGCANISTPVACNFTGNLMRYEFYQKDMTNDSSGNDGSLILGNFPTYSNSSPWGGVLW
jgi:hypothetical protein